MSGSAGHVMNLANSIIGVGLLAMPFCFKQCGITLAIALLVLSSIISRLACQFLIKSSALCRRRNFEFVAFYAFGPSGKLLVELGIIGFMMGTCVAFFVVMGDLSPAIVSKILNVSNSDTLRTCVLIALGLFVILPLGLLRNIESLVAISAATIGFYFLFTLKIFFESSHHLFTGDWWYHVNFWKPEGVLQCIPIFAMSLSCQMQLFEIYESISTPTADKINAVVHSAINLCTVVYASVGFLGYVAYCKAAFTGNILLSFSPSFSSEMFKLGFVMSIAVSFPLVIFPCRASLYSLIFKRMPIHHEASQMSSHIPDARFKWLTIGIVMVSLVTGLLIPSIELVLGFVGSTIGVAICVIFPSLSYLNLSSKSTNDKTVAKVTVAIGFLIMIMGTFGNLLAAVENSISDSHVSSPKLFNPNILDDSKILSKLEVANVQLSSIKGTKKLSDVNSRVPVKRAGLIKQIDGGIVSGQKREENQRKEPPVPVAPGLELMPNRKVAVPEVAQSIQNKIKREPKSKKLARISEVKANESINKDAIEKEEREIMEVEKEKEKEKKTGENTKDRELLRALKEQQEEQKKLLQKQEKILMEMKTRELKNEEKLNMILKEQSMSKMPNAKVQAIGNVKAAEEKKTNSSKKRDSGVNGDKVIEKIKLQMETRNATASNLKKIIENDEKNLPSPSPSPSSPPSYLPSQNIELKKLNSTAEKRPIKFHPILMDLDQEKKFKLRERRSADSDLQENEDIAKSEKCQKHEGDKDENPPLNLTAEKEESAAVKSEQDVSASIKENATTLIKNSAHVSVDVVADDRKHDAPHADDPKLVDSVLLDSSARKEI